MSSLFAIPNQPIGKKKTIASKQKYLVYSKYDGGYFVPFIRIEKTEKSILQAQKGILDISGKFQMKWGSKWVDIDDTNCEFYNCWEWTYNDLQNPSTERRK